MLAKEGSGSACHIATTNLPAYLLCSTLHSERKCICFNLKLNEKPVLFVLTDVIQMI